MSQKKKGNQGILLVLLCAVIVAAAVLIVSGRERGAPGPVSGGDENGPQQEQEIYGVIASGGDIGTYPQDGADSLDYDAPPETEQGDSVFIDNGSPGEQDGSDSVSDRQPADDTGTSSQTNEGSNTTSAPSSEPVLTTAASETTAAARTTRGTTTTTTQADAKPTTDPDYF